MSGGNPGICGGRRCLGGANDGVPCTVGSECPASLGCNRPGEPTLPNPCQDDPNTPADESFVCTDTAPLGDGLGHCVLGPFDQHCTNHPNRFCGTDGDCDDVPGACVAEPRPCFVGDGTIGQSISVSGAATSPVASHAATTLGMLACLPPSRVGAPDTVIGLPGLTRNHHVGDLTLAEKIVSAFTTPNGSVGTAPVAPASVVETTVTSPPGGLITIVSAFNGPPDPSGRRLEITAPTTSPTTPLTITFTLAASEVPPGGAADLDLFFDGLGPIPNCLNPGDAIPNDPCVTARTDLGGGAGAITVLSSTGGVFATTEPLPLACPHDPDTCRTPITGGKSPFALKDKTPDDKDQVQWHWSKGAATTLAELGDPTTADAYALCVYDASGLRMRMPVPAGGVCAGKPCWKANSHGFVYKNKDATPFGITKLRLKSGDTGKSQMQADGRGDLLPMPSLATLTPPLQVQLRNRTSGLCWGATYTAPFERLTPTDLKAKD